MRICRATGAVPQMAMMWIVVPVEEGADSTKASMQEAEDTSRMTAAGPAETTWEVLAADMIAEGVGPGGGEAE